MRTGSVRLIFLVLTENLIRGVFRLKLIVIFTTILSFRAIAVFDHVLKE